MSNADTPSPAPTASPVADATAASRKGAALWQGDRIDKELVADLLAQRDGPCVSVLMPTERAFPASQQNRLVLRNLLRDAAAAFEPASAAHAQPLLAPLRALLDDDDFWAHPTDGLALYSAPGFWRAVRTPVSMQSRLLSCQTAAAPAAEQRTVPGPGTEPQRPDAVRG
jgi:hypothetical protein